MNEKRFRIYLCGGPHCTPGGRDAIARALEDALWEFGLDGDVELRVSGCQSRCELAPNLTVWPGPVRYSSLSRESAQRIVREHLRDGTPVAEYLAPDG
jgi:(2Fe-2S) ferredoxin